MKILSIILLLILAPPESTASDLKLVTWNLNRLGGPGDKRNLNTLTDFMLSTEADLFCLQEIDGSRGGGRSFRKLLRRLNRASGGYEGFSGPVHGGERSAFIWKKNIGISVSPRVIIPRMEDREIFKVPPLLIKINWNGRIWEILNVHCFSRVEGMAGRSRMREYHWIREWLLNRKDQAALVMGDFNRFTGGRDAWSLFEDQQPGSGYRFPLLEAGMEDSLLVSASNKPGDGVKYQKGGESPVLRDQIAVTPPVWPYLGESRPGMNIGIQPWPPYQEPLSDHRPVWVLLKAVSRKP